MHQLDFEEYTMDKSPTAYKEYHILALLAGINSLNLLELYALLIKNHKVFFATG